MTDNILKNQLRVISKIYLDEIYGPMRKQSREALGTLFDSITTGQSTLVSDIARSIQADSSPAEKKRAQELVSGWLGRWDYATNVNPWLLARAANAPGDEATYAIDFSDISKEFGGAGMEGMAMGWDGSRSVTAMGHDFICVSLVGARHREARPVYVNIEKGRKSKGEMLDEAMSRVMSATGNRGWMVEDRGMDSAEHMHRVKGRQWKTVIRIKDMNRDVFGNGLCIDKGMESTPFQDVHLHTYRGDRKVKLRCKVGTVQHCEEPNKKDSPVHNVTVLVIESRFDEKSIWMYAVVPDEMISSPQSTFTVAARAAQSYCDRWQIETSFQTVKQEFALEKARVRTFKRLKNIFFLCVLAFVFVSDYLHGAPGFKKVLKFLSDNLDKVSTQTRALLAGLRALVREKKIRFISGRPRKPPKTCPAQMEFLLK